MSKSLGNSPDVIEVMQEYGADALRFTIVFLSPIGTDVLFAKEACEVGRNFANKLWNAARFLKMNSIHSKDNFKDYEHDIFDKWIISRFNSAIKDYSTALNEYKINEASKALYDFVWSEFCDWYIEILKIKAVRYPASAGKIFEDAVGIFESAVKLLHPVMPFITEELWHDLGEGRDEASISISDMPVLDEVHILPEAEQDIQNIQNLVSSVRNLRAEVKLSPSVKCDCTISCHSESGFNILKSILEYVKSLTKSENVEIGLNIGKPPYKFITSVTGDYQVYLKIEGLVDIQKEKERTQKEIERAERFLESVNKKLNNDGFVKKASEEVVENEKKKQADAISKLEKLKSHFKSLIN
jgi:valyl-tRNA synthetase